VRTSTTLETIDNFVKLWREKMSKLPLKNECIFGRLIDERRFDKFLRTSYGNKKVYNILENINEQNISDLTRFTHLVFEKNSNLASELETSLERNKNSKYEFTYSVYKFLVGPEMIKMKNGIMSLTPTGFEDSGSVHILVGFIVEILTDVVFESSIQRLKRNQLSNAAIEKELEDCLLTVDPTTVQQIGGFVSKSTLDRYRRSNYLDNEEAISIVKTLTHLRYLHSDAMEDEEYKKTVYPTDVKIKNKGGLYLVRKEMFPFFNHCLVDSSNTSNTTPSKGVIMKNFKYLFRT